METFVCVFSSSSTNKSLNSLTTGSLIDTSDDKTISLEKEQLESLGGHSKDTFQELQQGV